MTTLIVGCGYLGRRVGARLARRGERLLGTTRSAERAPTLANLGIEPVIADVLDPGSLAGWPEADRVLYCVGFDRSAGVAMRTAYVEGLRHALDRLAGRAGRLVYVGSTGVYGQTGGEWVDEASPTEPTHEAGRVALDAERLARRVGDRRGLPVVVVRYSGLYGPGRIVRRASLERGEPIAGDPARSLNLIHIDDAAEAAIAALDRGAPGEVYLASDDRPVARREYYTLAARLVHAPAPRFEIPAPGTSEARRDASNKRVSNRRMREALRVSLRFPDITTGLPAAIRAEAGGSGD
ncbi:MAG TPA: SDR family oxidoreductase [Isosphaeraceae bacterium]|nr:SDR family oxidoreductase [Isosphaeraceae bacterium]